MSTALPLDDAAFLVGDAAALQAAVTAPVLPVFSEQALDLLDELSRTLRELPECRTFPDLAALAFWCRRASLTAYKARYQTGLLLGRGLALQIAPGNVPLNFAYSLVAGLLSGNANAVRLPSDCFPQAELFCRELEALLSKTHPALRPYLICFRCGHESPVLSALSALCSVRVIWGGDQTIDTIRRMPLPPRAVELTFADRYSLCVIRAEAWLAAPDREELARRFYQDAYWSDQLACTAPRGVLWLGEAAPQARADFWPRISARARAEYPMPDVTAVKKREAALLMAVHCPGARLLGEDNYAVRVEVPDMTPDCLGFCTGGGFFVECTASSLEVLLPVAAEACQTVTAYGVERKEIEAFLTAYRPRGIDRVVPLGGSMDFDLTWDGYDLIGAMSRDISITL